MTEEYQSIIKNDVWEIVPRPNSKDVVSSRWLFKIKHAADGSIEKYKARFVAPGFFQNQFSRSWRVFFACLNSRSTSKNPELSNGVFRSLFGAREESQIFPARLCIFP